MAASDLGSVARRWLSPGSASPWRFDDRGDTLVWRDGVTVAFRAEIEASLHRVATNSEFVPPFPAVALLLAAARAEDRRIPSEHWDLVRDAMETETPWPVARVAAVKEVAETMFALRVLEEVPGEFFARKGALPLLVEAVFEHAGPRRDPKGAADFLRGVDAEPTPGTAPPDADEARRRAIEWGESLSALRRGLERLDPETLARRARTGLESDVVPAELAWPDAIRVRGVLAALRGDPDLGAVARLATDAMAAVRLPRPGASPEDLPIGGYADLAHRGSPERLLVSELAHDSLTLAVRVALHEALYLRREAPPRAPHGTRCVLVDSGIRLWGVGRVFATSVAMALAATSERGVSVRAWRARGQGIERVDLGSREGIEAHLEALQVESHPAAALRPFLAECVEPSAGVECCVVTHAKALGEPEMRDALRAARRTVYVVTVTAAGDLALHVFTPTGSQTLRTARLDLTSLLAQPPRTPGRRSALPLRDAARDDASLPAILRLERLPLRIPHHVPGAAFREAPGRGVVARTGDRRLFLWTEEDRGPIELTDRAPPGTLRDFRVHDDVVHVVTVGGHSVASSWLRAGIAEPFVEVLQLPSIGRTPSAAVVFGDSAERVGLVSGAVLFVVGADDVSCVAHEAPLPGGAKHARGRFFHRLSRNAWWALSHDGDGARFDEVSLAGERLWDVVTVFDRTGHDGPWMLLRRPFRVRSVATGEVVPFPNLDAPHFEFTDLSSSGNRFVFKSPGTSLLAVISLDGAAAQFVPITGPLAAVAEPMVASLHVLGVRRHAASIGRAADGGLRIDDRVLGRSKHGDDLTFAPVPRSELAARARFGWGERPLRLPGRRWELREAAWSDGSRAFLDARGMVHLVSSDRSAPEVTIVFRDAGIAAWCSDGATYGDRYFLGDSPSVAADEILRRIGRFTERLR